MKNIKFLSLILSLVLIFCMLLPLCVFAEDATESETTEETQSETESESSAESESESATETEAESKQPSAETSTYEFVYDLCDKLTTDEEKSLNDQIMDLKTKYLNKNKAYADIYLVVYDGSSGSEYWGEDFLSDHKLSLDGDIIILIVTYDKGGWFYDFYKYGNADKKISRKEVRYILDSDDVYDNIKNGSYEGNLKAGMSAFVTLSNKAFHGRVGANMFTIILICLIISVIIGAIACVSVIGTYNMKRRPTVYPLEKYTQLELKDSTDTFKGSYVRQRTIQSSGGHGGGGGGGSGHGGGAGHAGGR